MATTASVSRTPLVHTGSGAPGASHDSTKSYQQGDLYLDTATGFAYIASSVAVGAASWLRISNA